MRKTVTGTAATALQPVQDHEWLDLQFIASVEVTSEDPAFPIESALQPGSGAAGWRASEPAEQKITILFDSPTLLHLIHLHFVETAEERTQEFTLRWNGADGTWHEIARQRWNFSPSGSTSETENFRVNLAGVRALELAIIPDVSHGPALATLARLRFA